MPAEIDFSGGVRGKFYRPGAKLNLPAYGNVTEEDMRETLKGEAECDAGQVFPHAQVMDEVRAIIGKHPPKPAKKAD